MNFRSIMTAGTLGALLFTTGCRTCCKKRCDSPPNRLPPPNGAYIGTPSTIPPAGIVPERSSYYPPRAELLLPEGRGYSPIVGERSTTKPVQPNTIVQKLQVAGMPLGIADFTVIKDNIWTGLRPELDGLDWLKQNNVRQAVYLRNGIEDDQSDRQQFEKRGIAFESILVQPETLNADLYRRFASLVSTSNPVFVYDRAGAAKGYLWYIYFRIHEMLPDDVARVRADRLGYADSGTPERKELAAAAMRVIDQLK